MRAGDELVATMSEIASIQEPFLAVLPDSTPLLVSPHLAPMIAVSLGGRGPPPVFATPRICSLRAPPIA